MSSRSPVVRVRGLPKVDDPAAAEATVRKAIGENSTGEELDYQISIIAACDRVNELVALIDFAAGLPSFLSSLKLKPLGSHEVTVDNEELSFDLHFTGFTQLYNVQGDIRADVIAICGIGGHAYGSWQGRGNLPGMWLRHFLARDLPSCRVMTYGYNSKLSRPGFATLEDYSDELLEDLMRIRIGKAQFRPVIFIAHSFGGLMVARLLIKAASKVERGHPANMSLYQATYGMIFFAVPHLGIDVEDMSRLMEEEKNPRISLLTSIKINSSQLRTQLDHFKNILVDRKVVSFYEVEQSRRLVRTGMNEWKRTGEYFTSLDKQNAILQLPWHIETRIPLHRDHSTIVKYDSKFDHNYTRVSFRLQEFVRNAPQVVSQRFKEILGSRPPPSQSTRTLTVPSQNLTRLSQAEMRSSQGLGIQIETPKPDQIEELKKTFGAGRALANQGKYSDAIATYLIALAGYEKALGTEHPSTLLTVYNLGCTYYSQGEFAQAEAMYLRALASREKSLGSDHVDTLKTVHSLGWVYSRQNRLSEAEELYLRALAGREKSLGSDHVATLDAKYSLGWVYGRQAKLPQAETIYLTVLAGRQNTLGPNHIKTLDTMDGLGWVYSRQSKLPDAEEMYTKALAGREKTLGPDHADTLNTISNLGWVYSLQNKLSKAEEMYSRTLTGREKTLKSNHISTLSTMYNLGWVYSRQKRPSEAEKLLLRALAGFEKTLGPSHASTLETMHDLGDIYYGQDQLSKAEKTYLRALLGRERILGPYHIDVLDMMHNLGVIYRRQKQLSEAEKMFSRALAGRELIFGPNHNKTLSTVEELGWVCQQQDKLRDAEKLYSRAVIGRERIATFFLTE